MNLEYVVILVIAFIFGGIAGVSIEKQTHTPENIWALCQASPSVVWKSGPLEVRQDVRKHDYTCLMYLDGQGNKLPVILYKMTKRFKSIFLLGRLCIRSMTMLSWLRLWLPCNRILILLVSKYASSNKSFLVVALKV